MLLSMEREPKVCNVYFVKDSRRGRVEERVKEEEMGVGREG